jgi:hypothetical protein
MANNTQLLFEQAERLAPKLPYYASNLKVAINYFNKVTSLRAGERDVRIPFKTATGIRPRTYDPNFGSIGRGGYMAGGVGITTFYPFAFTFEIPQLAIEATASSETALRSAFKEALADAIPQAMIFIDNAWHAGYGTAVLAVASAVTTVSGNTVYTLADGSSGSGSINGVANFNFGVRLLRRGWGVSPYSNNLATQYAGGPYIIQSMNFNTNQLTLTGTVPGAQANDAILLEGVSGANPQGVNGLPYFIDDSTSGFTLGVNRATEPEIQSNGVDASSGLNHQLALVLFHKIFQRRGDRAKNLIGLCSDNAQYTIYGEVMNIARYDVGDGNKPIDLLPDVDMSFKFGGVKTMLDPHESISRIDWINTDAWGKVLTKDLSFYSTGDGRRYIPLYASDGAPAAGTWMGLTTLVNYYSDDPGCQGFIKNIPTQSFY